jgi:hypothetical protein
MAMPHTPAQLDLDAKLNNLRSIAEKMFIDFCI